MNGVLEGRARLAGGVTTGSSAVVDVAQGRAPAGAREACEDPTSAVMPGVFGCLSRPSRALSENARIGHADPVVAPPANVFRAFGTFASRTPTPGQPAFGTFASCMSTSGRPASGKRDAAPNLNPVLPR